MNPHSPGDFPDYFVFHGLLLKLFFIVRVAIATLAMPLFFPHGAIQEIQRPGNDSYYQDYIGKSHLEPPCIDLGIVKSLYILTLILPFVQDRLNLGVISSPYVSFRVKREILPL
jgi:hypothetical protein